MNIKLRPIELADTDNIVQWRNQEFVRLNFINRDILTHDRHIDYYNKYILTKKVFQFIILDGQKGIGTVFLRDVDLVNQKAEFGIFIGDYKYLNKGVGKIVTKMILNFGFNELKLNRIFLRVLEKNVIAISSYKKSGFIFEGCFRDDVYIDSEYVNIVFMSILKKEYNL